MDGLVRPNVLAGSRGDVCNSCNTIQGDYVGFNTGNGVKLSCSQAEYGQASCLAVA